MDVVQVFKLMFGLGYWKLSSFFIDGGGQVVEIGYHDGFGDIMKSAVLVLLVVVSEEVNGFNNEIIHIWIASIQISVIKTWKSTDI